MCLSTYNNFTGSVKKFKLLRNRFRITNFTGKIRGLRSIRWNNAGLHIFRWNKNYCRLREFCLQYIDQVYYCEQRR